MVLVPEWGLNEGAVEGDINDAFSAWGGRRMIRPYEAFLDTRPDRLRRPSLLILEEEL